MKNQYFGDRRDYFKYDVLERLATELHEVQRLTCLWMLTPPDGTGQILKRTLDTLAEDPALTARASNGFRSVWSRARCHALTG